MFISGDVEPDGSWFCHTKRALYHRVAERALNKSSLLCFDFWVKLRLCYSINDDVTLRFFWFKFTIFYRTRNDTNLTRHGVLAEFLFGIFIVVASVLIFSSDMVCLQRFFVFVLFIFLVNFINLSWKEFNIILIYWVELYYYLRFCFLFVFLIHVVSFLFGSWGWGGGGGVH